MHCQALLRHCLRVGAVAQERRPDEQAYWIIGPVVGFLFLFLLRRNSGFVPCNSEVRVMMARTDSIASPSQNLACTVEAAEQVPSHQPSASTDTTVSETA